MSEFKHFYDYPDQFYYSSNKIGDDLRIDNANRSTFKSVTEYCDDYIKEKSMNLNLEEDCRISKKNIVYLKTSLKHIQENFNEDLSKIAKEFGSMMLSDYDNFAAAINEQKCENLRMQEEIYTLNSEKNYLKHEIKLLINSVNRLENLLGVKPDPKFNNTVNQMILK